MSHLRTHVDHRKCRRGTHRTEPNPRLGEMADPETGRMCCLHCGRPMVFCPNAAARNKDGDGYEPTYIHVNAEHEESCP